MKGADAVWHRVDKELQRRRDAHQRPGTWAALGREIDASNQMLTNWKSRGVPPKQYQTIADALGWGVDQLLGNAEIAPQPELPPSSASVAARAERTVESPQEAELLEGFRWLTDDERRELVAEVAARARRYEEVTRRRALHLRGPQAPSAEVGRPGAGIEEMQAGLDLAHRLKGVPTPAEEREALESTPDEPASSTPTPPRHPAKSQ